MIDHRLLLHRRRIVKAADNLTPLQREISNLEWSYQRKLWFGRDRHHRLPPLIDALNVRQR